MIPPNEKKNIVAFLILEYVCIVIGRAVFASMNLYKSVNVKALIFVWLLKNDVQCYVIFSLFINLILVGKGLVVTGIFGDKFATILSPKNGDKFGSHQLVSMKKFAPVLLPGIRGLTICH